MFNQMRRKIDEDNLINFSLKQKMRFQLKKLHEYVTKFQ